MVGGAEQKEQQKEKKRKRKRLAFHRCDRIVIVDAGKHAYLEKNTGLIGD